MLGDTAGAFSSLADFLQLAKGGGSPEGYVNTMADLLGQQMQVGGRDVDYRELLNLIMGATNTGNNPLYALLTQRPNDPTNTELTPEEQISMLTDVANLARLGMTPMTARAFSALLSSGARDWQSSLLGNAQGAAPTFVDYLRQSGLLQGLQ
ncbi:MAG: hypothetical protein C4523_08845 [Myxococcales bacterium]|nr:MAG: hypothetical protein C4523_08845 [Myxococcales bacterium]